MSDDEEQRISGKEYYTTEKHADVSPQRSADVELYNGEAVTQDRGILSRLRYLEARLDAKLGVESEAITRKLPEDKKPVSFLETLYVERSLGLLL